MKRDNTIENTIVKTVIATSSAAIAVFVALILSFSFAFPSLMGKLCKNIGFYGLATGFYERSYERSGDVGDYSVFMDCAVFVADKSGEYEKVATVGEDVLKFKNDLNDDDYSYFAVSVVRAKYELGDGYSAAEFAVNSSYGARTLPLEYAKILAEKDESFKQELNKFIKG